MTSDAGAAELTLAPASPPTAIPTTAVALTSARVKAGRMVLSLLSIDGIVRPEHRRAVGGIAPV
ncbi:hypothetical protein [Streptomyces sp. A1499]|uniref:hypothetical protein n=1 Tax=Streptomyces sp. A1499 TaxID=2563104 RepID=UPI001F0F5DDC|nr:hypothetical protein [Streptomyces sp. A1499]